MQLVDITRLSKMLNVKPKTIYDWVQKRKIPHYKLEGSLRFSYDEIQQWIKSKRQEVIGKVGVH